MHEAIDLYLNRTQKSKRITGLNIIAYIFVHLKTVDAGI